RFPIEPSDSPLRTVWYLAAVAVVPVLDVVARAGCGAWVGRQLYFSTSSLATNTPAASLGRYRVTGSCTSGTRPCLNTGFRLRTSSGDTPVARAMAVRSSG